MAKKSRDDTVSIRLRLDRETIDRIDELVGESGRQRFIREAVLGRLNEELPPVIYELLEDVRQLTARVDYLEELRETSVFHGELNETIKKHQAHVLNVFISKAQLETQSTTPNTYFCFWLTFFLNKNTFCCSD